MARILFIDEDQAELRSFSEIVAGVHDCRTVLWPKEVGKLHLETLPDVIVSDLYLPSISGDASLTDEQRSAISASAKKSSEGFGRVASDTNSDDKSLVRDMMSAISAANDTLKQQWSAMGQSPDHGIAILKQFKALYPALPFVFYSRKITPEDVVRVFQEGAVDAIRKGAFTGEQVLARLAETIRKTKVQKIERQESTKVERPASESSRPEPEATNSKRVDFSARPTVITGWIDAGTKAFGLFTALFAFLLARGKFLD